VLQRTSSRRVQRPKDHCRPGKLRKVEQKPDLLEQHLEDTEAGKGFQEGERSERAQGHGRGRDRGNKGSHGVSKQLPYLFISPSQPTSKTCIVSLASLCRCENGLSPTIPQD
jgi:hypothetical protein